MWTSYFKYGNIFLKEVLPYFLLCKGEITLTKAKKKHTHTCSKCGTYYEDLNIGFMATRTGKEGHMAVCRICWNERCRELYHKRKIKNQGKEKRENVWRTYSEDDLFYLERSWGLIPVSDIAKKLGRNEKSIKLKAYRMGLGSQLDNMEVLIKKDVINLLNSELKVINNYIKNHNLPFKKSGKRMVISYENFVQWLYDSQEVIKWEKVDKVGILSLGFDNLLLEKLIEESKQKTCRRTLSDKEKLKIKEMYNNFNKYEDIARKMDKEISTIKWYLHTCFKNGELVKNDLKGRLVRNINREGYGWTEWQDRQLVVLYRQGKTLKEIANIVGKPLSTVKSRNQKLTRMIMEGKFAV